MRKLKLQMQMSVDGYVSGPTGDLDWMVWDWDKALKEYVVDLTNSTELILLGRKMADGFLKYWTDLVKNKPDDPEFEFGKQMVEYPKVVFTRTLNKNSPEVSAWENTTLATGNLKEEIENLKSHGKKDIIVYGGASFVASLISAGFIDELHLFINPVALGGGKTIFHSLKERQDFTLKKSIAFDCGIVLLCYGRR